MSSLAPMLSGDIENATNEVQDLCAGLELIGANAVGNRLTAREMTSGCSIA
jgi:hypothetical protein